MSLRSQPGLRALLLAAAVLSAAPASADAGRHLGLHDVRTSGDVVTGVVGLEGPRERLTLDPRLQRLAERLLAQAAPHEGAIVVSDVRTGRVLVWATRGPLDYVATPLAPSASLFKLVTTAALLESGRVSAQTRECYSGGEHAIQPRDLVGKGDACTTLGEALGKSINAVFARLAKKHLSPSALRRFAAELGFSGTVPVDVPVGASVTDIPDDPFLMARAAAGFWNGRLTPLGALFAMQTIARGGDSVPFVVLDRDASRASVGRPLSAGVADSMRRMLEVTTSRGTAARAFRRADGTRALAGVRVAGKTGTLIGDRPVRMYSWFAGFAPADRPAIAISVLLGNDVRWHAKANLVGREMLEGYFEHRGTAVALDDADPGNHRALSIR